MKYSKEIKKMALKELQEEIDHLMNYDPEKGEDKKKRLIEERKRRIFNKWNPFELVYFAIKNKIIREDNLPGPIHTDYRSNDPMDAIVFAIISQTNEKTLNRLVEHHSVLYRREYIDKILRLDYLTDPIALKLADLITKCRIEGRFGIRTAQYYYGFILWRLANVKDKNVIVEISKKPWLTHHLLLNKQAPLTTKREVFLRAVTALEAGKMTKKSFVFEALSPMSRNLSENEVLRFLRDFPEIAAHMPKCDGPFPGNVGREVWRLCKPVKHIEGCRWMPGDVLSEAWEMTRKRVASKDNVEKIERERENVDVQSFCRNQNTPLRVLREAWVEYRKDESSFYLERTILENDNCDEKLATDIIMHVYSLAKKDTWIRSDLEPARKRIPKRKYDTLIRGLEAMKKLQI